MSVRLLTLGRATAGLVLILVVSGCSVGADSSPTTAPAADATTPLVAPAATTDPTSSPVAADRGGRYGSGAKPTPKPAPKSTPKPTAPAPTVTIKPGSTALGTVIVNADGLTLYTHAGDSATHSTCTGACASAWPPLLVKAGTKVKGGTGVHGTFTTFKRSDGGIQVAYKGRPLYSWTGDYYPGDTTGQGVNGFSVAKV